MVRNKVHVSCVRHEWGVFQSSSATRIMWGGAKQREAWEVIIFMFHVYTKNEEFFGVLQKQGLFEVGQCNLPIRGLETDVIWGQIQGLEKNRMGNRQTDRYTHRWPYRRTSQLYDWPSPEGCVSENTSLDIMTGIGTFRISFLIYQLIWRLLEIQPLIQIGIEPF